MFGADHPLAGCVRFADKTVPDMEVSGMSELIWLNGQVMPLSEARISVEDRGFQFADGVYEVIRIYNGKCFTLREHLDRLDRSSGGLGISMPLPSAELAAEVSALVTKSGLRDGMVYQIGRASCRVRV